MGPPETDPSWLTLRYLTPKVHSTNFEDIPKIPAKTIQNVAPGPPVAMAIATPEILPNPTVPERAVVNAWKWETCPEPLCFSPSNLSYFPATNLTACLKPEILINLK